MDTIRAFMAVPLDANTIESVSRLQESLKTKEANVKWVNPKNMHLTLIFLGEVSESHLPRYYGVLDKCAQATPSFTLSFQGLGAFPGVKRPRVLWIGVKEGKEEITRLADLVRTSLGQALLLGDEVNHKKYSPHLTLGRVRSQEKLPELSKILNEKENFWAEPIKIKEFLFIKSQLTRRGPVYSVLKKFTLK